MDKSIQNNEARSRTGMEIAVIGMSGRFPGAENIDEFWNNLKQGVESISFFSDQELKESGISSEVVETPGYVKVKGSLENIEDFDAAFFDYTVKEAEIMDPQLRLLHESCWMALENAGYDPLSYKGLIGFYAGASSNHHWLSRFLSRMIENRMGENELFEIGSLNSNSSFCTRISYKLNLKGPSIFVQTACSTSLVAIHLACQGLLAGECDMALAGGVSISIPKKSGYFYQEGMLHSLKGHVRTFDAKADGTVFGNGVGIVVLKPLEEAIAEGDTLYAVVKGSAVNNDGFQKVGFTAPGTKGQAAVIRAALRAAEVEPESISYIEAHGTGTTLGDPIEIEALNLAFNTGKTGFCKVGSVKSNIGHLDAAAGVASFIKTVLALKHKMIPVTLNVESPNPEIDFENSPFLVNTTLTKWKNEKYPLRAGVSSFGIGGTNAHVILEEAPPCAIGQPSFVNGQSRQHQLILLSARTESALDKMTENVCNYLKNNHPGHPFNTGNPGLNLADAAYTLQVGRKAFEWRRMWVFPGTGSKGDRIADTLTSEDSQGLTSVVSQIDENKPVIFMFPGQGAQYVNMGLNLYKTEPVFRKQMDRCFEILKPLMAYDINAILYPQNSVSKVSRVNEGSGEISTDASVSHMSHALENEKIKQTEIAQPILFMFEYALSKLLMTWGIKPYAMMGHSIGEYTAACLAGVFSLQDALTAVALRGKLMQQMPGGSMLSISLPEEEVIPLLPEEISLAAVNSPESCAVSGTHEAIAALAKKLEEKGSSCRRLHTSHAFHSQMMEPILIKFAEKVKEIKLNQPEIPYISNLTGNWITLGEAGNPGYWAKHLSETVRFSEGVQKLLKNEEDFVFVEVGPGKTLSTFVNQHKKNIKNQWVVNLIKHPKEDVPDDYYLLRKIGQLWLYGVFIDWNEFYAGEKRHRIPLPTYPFEGQRYWFDENLIPMRKIVKESGEPGTIDSIESERQERLHKRPGLRTVYIPPKNEIEQKLVNIWEKFFGVGQIGIDDDFFELGGDSLKTSIIISKIHKDFNAEVPVAEFFKRPTIGSLALFIADHIGKDIYSSIEPVEKKEYYQLSSAQKRLYILNEIDNQGIGYNLPSIFILEGILNNTKLEDTFRTLLKRHESLRTSFHMMDDGPVQRVHEEVEFEIEYYNSGNKQEMNPESILKNFTRPFDLSQAPLLRVGLIKEKEEKHILMVDMHHIISDGTSMGVLIRESMLFFGGEKLPELRIQYKDFSEWQDSEKVRDSIKQQESYWLKQFEGKIPLLNLPMDYARPTVKNIEGKRLNFELGIKETSALKKMASDEDATLFMVLLAVYNIFLSKLSGQEDIVIGIPRAGRGHVDLENIIGILINTFALRNYPEDKMTFRAFLKEVRERTIQAFENQDYQFEDLVEKLGIQRNARRTPLFEVVLNFLNDDVQLLEGFKSDAPNLKVIPYKGKVFFPIHDLTLYPFDAGEKIFFSFEYCTKLFEKETIETFIKYFKEIASIVTMNNEIKLEDINISNDLLHSEWSISQEDLEDFGF
jgi:acyl transferase domain-containing protein